MAKQRKIVQSIKQTLLCTVIIMMLMGAKIASVPVEAVPINAVNSKNLNALMPDKPTTTPAPLPADSKKPKVLGTEDFTKKKKTKKTAEAKAADAAIAHAKGAVFVDDVKGKDGFDEAEIRQRATTLVERAMGYLKQNSLEKTAYAISRTKEFIDGGLTIFMIDSTGNYLASGEESYYIWRPIKTLRDRFGVFTIESIIQVAKQGGGWLTYEWRNVPKVSYVQMVEKNGVNYIIGSGYYAFSKPDSVLNLVKGAVASVELATKEGKSVSETFSEMSYPMGRFVEGDLYLFAYDFDGNTVAHGGVPGFIGTNQLDLLDDNGQPIHKIMIERLQKSDVGIWIDYVYIRAKKRSYVEKVKGPDEKMYFIGCGYYIDAGKDAVIDLVRRGYEYMKRNGKSVAAQAFTTRNDNTFRYGDLYVMAFDMSGKCIAHGANADLIDTNMYDVIDEGGHYYVREIIDTAKKGGGWVDSELKNSIKSIYVERVDLGVDQVALASGVFPLTKRDSMVLLAKSGVSHLQSAPTVWDAFTTFTDRTGRFIRGDLFLFVYDTKGYAYVYGDDRDVAWRNMLEYKDDDGRQFIKLMTNETVRGSATLKLRFNGEPKEVYVERVSRGGTTYLVGSSMYVGR